MRVLFKNSYQTLSLQIHVVAPPLCYSWAAASKQTYRPIQSLVQCCSISQPREITVTEHCLHIAGVEQSLTNFSGIRWSIIIRETRRV